MYKNEHVVKEQDLYKLVNENPNINKTVQHLIEFEQRELGTALFMGLPVNDYEAIDKAYLKLQGYLECLLEQGICKKPEFDLLKSSLNEIYTSKVEKRHHFAVDVESENGKSFTIL